MARREERIIMGLRPTAYLSLPPSAVRPRGWLRDQLELQASGLSGEIETVWEDLGPRSGWRGGDGESWERGPYYLDGLIPLAHALDRADLKERAAVWLEWMLRSQRPDGLFGPEETRSRWGPGWWYLTPALKALMQHHDATADARVLPLMERFFRYQGAQLEAVPLREWSSAREGETDLVLQWLYHRTGEDWLLDHARRLRRESFDWTRYFRHFPWPEIPRPFEFRHETHIVNVAMALKYPALWSLWSDDPEDASAMPQGLWTLDAHHGQANGLLAGDEHLNGRRPTRGSELCGVVEMMFSLEQLLLITGEGFYADRLELVAYNALPATFDGRMRIHQYLQQVNQVLCSEAPRPWINNGPRANLFGLEPEFGCCTANFHQAWPRFAGSLWMRTRDGGLACGALAPSEVTAAVAGGHRVAVHEQTLYPFGDEVTFTITAGEDVYFPLDLRIPGWCRAATVDDRPAAAGSRVRIERSWSVGDRVVLKLPRRLRGERRHRGALSLYAGPLLMALPIPDRWELLPGESEPFGDRAVHPRGPWSYALELSDGELERIEVPAAEVHEVPFDEELPPLRLPLRGRRVADWELVNHEAGPTPRSPLRIEGPSKELTLVPFGATILRIAEFPTVGPGEGR